MKNALNKISDLSDLSGVRCDVLGLGVSNLPLVDLLASVGANITVYDKKTKEELGECAERLENMGITLRLGEFPPKELGGEVIFRSPGIRQDLPVITAAKERGAILTSEMELFIALTPAALIGITGSDGKTTTTTLTHLFIKKQFERHGGRCFVGGNIGRPLLPECKDMKSDDVAVLELSSFQLITLSTPLPRCAITNITPNHLNWHTDMQEYTEAKCRIFGDESLLILNAENPATFDIARARKENMVLFSSKRHSFEEIVAKDFSSVSAIFERDGKVVFSDGATECEILSTANIKLPGIHNLENYMTAIALTYGMVDLDIYDEVAKTFGGVEHRLEWVAECDGVSYYNSSIDSSPTRTEAALSALKGPKVVICGGRDKNVPFDGLAAALCKYDVKCVVLTGEAADKIYAALCLIGGGTPVIETHIESDFDAAVLKARSLAKKGDAVLLSPACTSFDRFKHFEERGARFKGIVHSFCNDEN
ncbi:MAG: UDP-N-acetylmuramoyl-L-alanine--D-glutamate ligase [Clostridia bacterium]|nr:UDP-N-acetylmuramoyl-L-alanine--D-glutamate ligase [Clostridia bacterium]